ncbi:hypothetical protein [Piscinibacter gummiphilus]|uniref:Uncharacterized protein n=1 Tax=Piscinibacter gummiphilus TaxID=946333 RepID=A0A1W6LDZ9_9BURK|nr:hypothetical protein [Piscinibacter gummiphilus]ARN22446.1 hypothetical protein A4W93_22465 [Piscinibacter gummiphilus]ATU67141.1 hypothetical protein CPZ87_22595 [Piscinibacter gummiphilus]GLS98028.1 hypothetical protein GCM10007918_53200 [Piscinibacter gummiphilus]
MSIRIPRPLHTAARLASLLVTVGALAACHAEAASSMGRQASSSSSAGANGSVASGSFKGLNGTVHAAGHELRAQDGQLTLDGKPYGTVDDRAVAQLLVREGQAPMVTVNALVRYATTN